MKIENHPNSILKREIEILKEEIKNLKYHQQHNAKALLVVNEKFDEIKNIVKKTLNLINQIPVLRDYLNGR